MWINVVCLGVILVVCHPLAGPHLGFNFHDMSDFVFAGEVSEMCGICLHLIRHTESSDLCPWIDEIIYIGRWKCCIGSVLELMCGGMFG